MLRVRDVDERTGRVAIDSTFDGVAVTIESFARDAAHELDVDRLRPAEPRQPVGEAVAVVGASRGLGAALALAFLQRGYEVHGIYSMSTDDAHELQGLAGDGASRLFMHQADATSAARLDQIAADVRARGVPLRGLVLAAAAPPLGMSLDGESAGDLARYVGESVRLAAAPLGAVLPLLDRGWVVFCSSSAMSAPPRDWPHYIAAKGALEGLASWLAAAAPGVASVVVRPPKLLTEMTNTPAGRIGAAPVEPFAGRLADVVEGLPPGLTLLGPRRARRARGAAVTGAVPTDLAGPWEALTDLSETYTCYSSALATWTAVRLPSWRELLDPGLHLGLVEADDLLFGFSHFLLGLAQTLGLVRRSTDAHNEAVEAIVAESKRNHRVIVAGDGFNLPWHVAHARRHVPHWFVVAATGDGPTVGRPVQLPQRPRPAVCSAAPHRKRR